jgi:hypothetical protein
MAEFNWYLETQKKVVLADSVVHSYLRNDTSVEDCVIENTDAPSQFPYATIIRRSGWSVSEEATSVRKKCRQYFENIRSIPGKWKQ